MDATETETDTESNARIANVFVAFAGRVTAIDMAFFRLLATFNLPKSLVYSLILLVRSGDGWIWALIAGALWLCLPFPEMERVVLHCLLAIGISLAMYFPIKFIGRRLRPSDKGVAIKTQVPPLDKYSFPSGHTMNNLAVALTLASHFPSLFLPAIAIPILLGTLRVLFGVHYLSDIIGGSVLGAFAFTLAKAFFPLSGP
jgi:undecaprenyl-diphosphatase